MFRESRSGDLWRFERVDKQYELKHGAGSPRKRGHPPKLSAPRSRIWAASTMLSFGMVLSAVKLLDCVDKYWVRNFIDAELAARRAAEWIEEAKTLSSGFAWHAAHGVG